MPLVVIAPPSNPVPAVMLVTVPTYWSVLSTVIVVPEMVVVTFVPPSTVIVPVSVMAVPEPLSAAGVMLVTVP